MSCLRVGSVMYICVHSLAASAHSATCSPLIKILPKRRAWQYGVKLAFAPWSHTSVYVSVGSIRACLVLLASLARIAAHRMRPSYDNFIKISTVYNKCLFLSEYIYPLTDNEYAVFTVRRGEDLLPGWFTHKSKRAKRGGYDLSDLFFGKQ